MTTSQTTGARYDALCDAFFDAYYTYHPSHATRQGLHQYDGHLGHYRRDEIDETLRKIKTVQRQVAAIDPKSMDPMHALDHPVLTTRMKREVYWIETWRHWEQNPLFYKDAITEGVFNLVSRNFAPLEERLKAVVGRERDVPDVLRAARENLTNPPPELTEQAIRYFKGAKVFFNGIVPEFDAVKDSELKKEFHEANMRVLEELDQFQDYLENDLMPRSHGNFAVGEDGIQAILDCEEDMDTPVKDILARCYSDLEKTEAEIQELSKQIDPHKTPEVLREQLKNNHPSKEDLLPAMKQALADMRRYLTERNLMTIPPEMPDVIVSPMPTYRSAGGMMLTPGPFETRAKEAYMAINLPQPGWTEERLNQQLRDFNLYNMTLLFLHEAYPGHHVQFFLEKRVPMRASKDHDSDSNSDGWADYGKYMMIDEIYGPTDPFFRLATLHGKRSSILASIVGLEIHMQTRSIEDAALWMAAQTGRPAEGARARMDRAIYYPTHLTYYIGSEMMRKLRNDYTRMRGSQFNLKEFHDRFMTYGLIPIKVIRQDMLEATDDQVLF
jgi:uncharacterized protein (DUF885 family)